MKETEDLKTKNAYLIENQKSQEDVIKMMGKQIDE